MLVNARTPIGYYVGPPLPAYGDKCIFHGTKWFTVPISFPIKKCCIRT